MKQQNPHQIVIVGGGAGGLILAIKLGRKYRKDSSVNVILVDKSLTHLWKPLLHEVAAGTLDSNENEINFLGLAYHNGFEFQLGRLKALDKHSKQITLESCMENNNGDTITIPYNTLILALGSVTNDFGIPGVSEYCYYLDDRVQADKFHQHILSNCLKAKVAKELKPGQLDIAIIGGGATGVELAAELHYTIRQMANYGIYQLEPKKHVNITIIEASNRILSTLSERLSEDTMRILSLLNIKVLTSERVVAVDKNALTTQSGLIIKAQTIVWAAGIVAPSLLKEFKGLETNDNNQLKVLVTLQVTEDEHIFAFGDCAECPQKGSDEALAPRAQVAYQQGLFLYKTIIQLLKNKDIKGKDTKKSLPDFSFYDYGSLVSLSHYSAVGNIMGNLLGRFFVTGLLARIFYKSLYKKHQIAIFGPWRVLLLTIANMLTKRVKPRLKLH